jgi:hypothetical protein
MSWLFPDPNGLQLIEELLARKPDLQGLVTSGSTESQTPIGRASRSAAAAFWIGRMACPICCRTEAFDARGRRVETFQPIVMMKRSNVLTLGLEYEHLTRASQCPSFNFQRK